jgi:hypothetical protein
MALSETHLLRPLLRKLDASTPVTYKLRRTVVKSYEPTYLTPTAITAILIPHLVLDENGIPALDKSERKIITFERKELDQEHEIQDLTPRETVVFIPVPVPQKPGIGTRIRESINIGIKRSLRTY